MKGGIFIIIFLLSIESLAAQWRPPRLHHFGPDQGLTSRVRDMDQDAQGYMYFASDQGMYRYDGNAFNYFGHDASDSTSISSGHVFDLHVSQDQKVYLALFGPYLNVFDPNTQIFQKFKLPKSDAFDTQLGISLAEDIDGNIWIGGENYQLFKFDPITKQISSFSAPWLDNAVKNGRYGIVKIHSDLSNKNILWLTVKYEKPLDINYSVSGLVQFNIENQTFKRVNGAGKIQLEDQYGHLWGAVWGDFITEMNPTQNTTKIHSFKYLYDQLPNSSSDSPGVGKDIVQYQNKLMIACEDILQLDEKNKFEFFYDYRDGTDASDLFVDKSNNLWIGLANGVDVYRPQNDQIYYYSLSSLGEDKRIYPGRIAYNSDNQSFYLVGSTSNNLSQIYKIPHPKYFSAKPLAIDLPIIPQAIFQESKQSMLVSGGGKVYALDLTTNKTKEKNIFQDSKYKIPFLYKLFSDENDWVVGFGHDKLIYWQKGDQHQNQIIVDDLNGSIEDFFTNVQFYGQNQMVVTTRSNAYLIDLATGENQKLHIQKDNPFQYITGLGIDKDHNIWISSLSELVRFSRNGLNITQEEVYALKEGIKSPTIQELFIDRLGKVWIFHNSGMDCLNPATHEIRNIGSREGLPNTLMDPVQIVETDDGYLATNCGNGLIIWHPDSLWRSLDAPNVPLVIQSIQVNGKAIDADLNQPEKQEYYLPKGPKVVNIKYQGLAYPTDKKVRYSYRFKNRDSSWISTGFNNQLILSELPYGKNYLEIKSGDPDIPAPSVKATLHHPTPLLANFWFYTLLSAIILGGLFILYKWRVKELRNKEEQKTFYNKKVAELELTALRSQMNPHFMFNSLNSIKTYILEAKPDIAADYLSQFSHLIRRILQNSREKKISLEEEIETLTLYIQLEQFRFEHAFEFNIDIDPTIDLSEIMIPPMLLQPFIENAIWHGLMHMDDKGRLNLEFIQNSGYISCIIEDNGIGREKAKELKSLSARKYKSMGMNITQNRVQLLNTIDSLGITLDIIDKYDQSNMAKGTKVILKIPIYTDE